MSVTCGEIRELLGEHEGIRYQLRFLVKSRENLAAKDHQARERLWAYRYGLYDFRDAIQSHIEVDERIFKAIPADISTVDSNKEHRTIQAVIDELIRLADSSIFDKLGPEELYWYAEKIGLAFNKIRELIEAHIARENAVLHETLKKLETTV